MVLKKESAKEKSPGLEIPRVTKAIRKLKRVCQERGQKTELAVFLFGEPLHVSQVRVAEMLRQRYEPRAEILLKARDWAKKNHGVDILD